MDKWVVPLAVAVVAAIATIGAAYLAAAKDRRDVRTAILRDLEIASKLQEGNLARRILEQSINERVLGLTADKERATATRKTVARLTGAYGLVGGFYAGRALGDGEVLPIAVVMFATAVAWGAVVTIAWSFNSYRTTAENARISELRERIRHLDPPEPSSPDDQPQPDESEDETPPPA